MAGDKITEEQPHAVWFAAGTAVLIACAQRAIMVSIFTRWRVWAFLALNLLLLAILFTSTKPQTLKNEINRGNGEDDDSKSNGKKKKADENRPSIPINGGGESVTARDDRRVENGEGDDEKGGNGFEDELTEEELNEKVEAFIAMFRQQYLVSDIGNKEFVKGKSVISCQGSSRRRVSFSGSKECSVISA